MLGAPKHLYTKIQIGFKVQELSNTLESLPVALIIKLPPALFHSDAHKGVRFVYNERTLIENFNAAIIKICEITSKTSAGHAAAITRLK